MLTKTPHLFDDATKVTAGDSRWRGQTSQDYWAFVGPFGGATAATILRALIEHPQRSGDPLALTVNYCAPIAEGAFDLDVRLVKANRSSQHWCVEMTQGGDDIATGDASGPNALRASPAQSPAPAAPVSAAGSFLNRRYDMAGRHSLPHSQLRLDIEAQRSKELLGRKSAVFRPGAFAPRLAWVISTCDSSVLARGLRACRQAAFETRAWQRDLDGCCSIRRPSATHLEARRRWARCLR